MKVMNFLIFRDFSRFFLNFFEILITFLGVFRIKNKIFQLKINYYDYY